MDCHAKGCSQITLLWELTGNAADCLPFLFHGRTAGEGGDAQVAARLIGAGDPGRSHHGPAGQARQGRPSYGLDQAPGRHLPLATHPSTDPPARVDQGQPRRCHRPGIPHFVACCIPPIVAQTSPTRPTKHAAGVHARPGLRRSTLPCGAARASAAADAGWVRRPAAAAGRSTKPVQCRWSLDGRPPAAGVRGRSGLKEPPDGG
jgi:hypothetical protein